MTAPGKLRAPASKSTVRETVLCWRNSQVDQRGLVRIYLLVTKHETREVNSQTALGDVHGKPPESLRTRGQEERPASSALGRKDGL